MDKNFYSFLGICMKAGKLKTGEENCEKLLRSGSAKLVLLADDSSENTRKKFEQKAFYYKVPLAYAGDRDELSKAVGKVNRAVYAVIDDGFAKSILKRLEDGQQNT
jgi:ribosomal protein L7Ae-like RNA K-turn-binding protein